MDSFWAFFIPAALAALSSPAGGAVSMLVRPSSLLLSIMSGLAGGVLLGAIGFEMVPSALDHANLVEVAVGFLLGVALVYAFDLFVNRGIMAGHKAEQHDQMRRLQRRRGKRGDRVTVLAGATSAEEVVEGLVIGISAAVGGGMGIIIATAIALDNISEALSIGEMVWKGRDRKAKDKRIQILGWTGLIGLSLIASACVGWFTLRSLPADWIGFLTALGAGAIFYLAVTNLLIEAEENQFQQSGGLAAAAGYIAMLLLTDVA